MTHGLTHDSCNTSSLVFEVPLSDLFLVLCLWNLAIHLFHGVSILLDLLQIFGIFGISLPMLLSMRVLETAGWVAGIVRASSAMVVERDMVVEVASAVPLVGTLSVASASAVDKVVEELGVRNEVVVGIELLVGVG